MHYQGHGIDTEGYGRSRMKIGRSEAIEGREGKNDHFQPSPPSAAFSSSSVGTSRTDEYPSNRLPISLVIASTYNGLIAIKRDSRVSYICVGDLGVMLFSTCHQPSLGRSSEKPRESFVW